MKSYKKLSKEGEFDQLKISYDGKNIIDEESIRLVNSVISV